MKHLFIINPVAGKKKNRFDKTLSDVTAFAETLGEPYEIYVTKAPRDAVAKVAQAAGESDSLYVYACGGDGTLSECADGAAGHPNAAVTHYPCGTGNDFIKSLQLPKEPVAALKLQLNTAARRIDCGALNGTPFINVSGMGLDIDVLLQTEKYKRLASGLIPYLLGLIQALRHFRPFAADVVIDGVAQSSRYTIISVANGRYFGGGMKVAPFADVCDGAFDVMLIDEMPKWKMCVLLPLFLPGLHTKMSVCRRMVAKDVLIKRDRPFVVEMDGELAQVQQAHFQIKPGGLLICSPVK